MNGLVLDLRSNPGGSLDEAVALSDLFLDNGQHRFAARARAAARTSITKPKPMFRGDMAKGVPIVVLIDAGSASASEIVAGALQDHRRALVMGERSFGKGSVQSLLPLGRDAALKLTTARYYTPSGHSVQEGGIKPDIKVPQLSDPDLARRDEIPDARKRFARPSGQRARPEGRRAGERQDDRSALHQDGRGTGGSKASRISSCITR